MKRRITESEFVFEINHGFCFLNCDEDRSQFRNKEIVTKRFLEVIKKGWRCRKLEKQQNPKSAIRKRIKNKKMSQIKKNRRKPNLD
jgi:ribosome-associated protein